MDTLIEKLVAQTGIDRNTAERVVDFLKNNWDDVVKWIGAEKGSDAMDKVKGMFQ